MRAALTKRRVSGGGGLTFWTQTSWARPTTLAGTPAGQQKPFTTISQLKSLLSSAVSGDYIYYNGTGVLQVSSSSTNACVLNGYNPSGTVSVDFGTKASTGPTNWGATTSGNYVQFNYSGTGGFQSIWIYNCSNINFYGGEIIANKAATVESGGAAAFNGPITNVIWYDSVIHDVPASGLWVNANSSSGTASTITGLKWRGEVYNFAMNPAVDTAHADSGTGMQGLIMHGSVGTLTSSTFATYCHDSLAPGAVGGNGVVQPEGGGGSAIEIGQSGGSNSNNTYYALGVNLLMNPNGTNPTSTGSQTAGNVIQFFGSDTQNGVVIGWVEGQNCSGACVHGGTGGWTSSSPMISVTHGRHTNVNQSTSGSNIAEPYDSRWGIIYNDCT